MNQEWRTQARCRGDAELMYDTEAVEEARAVCLKCPVLAECREWIMADEKGAALGSRWGVTAALTPKERRRLDQYGEPTHGTTAGYEWHRRNGEDACQPCKRAESRASAERNRRARKRAKEAAA